ncbi:hypothetical protein BDZ91DRAFT_419332 [Kalaharituber pfeilii]|nr:hypothetical protein BDZ91DRAFT_419332 [Kalaharituber pfeilii]
MIDSYSATMTSTILRAYSYTRTPTLTRAPPTNRNASLYGDRRRNRGTTWDQASGGRGRHAQAALAQPRRLLTFFFFSHSLFFFSRILLTGKLL